jgi:RNA polymerase sigma-70 factor (ECF subfamily)
MKLESSAPLDRRQLEELYTRLEKPIYNVVYRWVWDREEARDLVRGSFIRLWRMKRRVQIETVEPLIYRIALNLAANRRRAKKIRRWISLDSANHIPSENRSSADLLESQERNHAVRRAVEALPERLRRVIMLSEFSALTYEQIGHTLGIPPGTVGSRRNAAMKLLQQQLGHIVEENHGR